MDQQQKPISIDKSKLEKEISGAFVMPAIKTMADDIERIGKGGSEKVYVSSQPSPRPVATRQPQASGKNIVLPKAEITESTGFPWGSVVVGLVIALVLFVGGWTALNIFTGKSNTIADKIPVETLAFMSVGKDSGGFKEAIMPKALEAVGASSDSISGNWTRLAYVLIPGSTASEPVPFVLIEGKDAKINVDAAKTATKKLANDVTALIDPTLTGKLDGLAGKFLGKDNGYLDLARRVPKSENYIFIKRSQLGTILSPFVFDSSTSVDGVLISLDNNAGKLVAVYGVKGNKDVQQAKEYNWSKVLSSIPTTTLTAAAYPNVAKSIDDWRVKQTDNAQIRDFLSALSSKGEALSALKSKADGPFIVGTLPTDKSDQLDAFAIIPVSTDSSSDVIGSMKMLEEALKNVAPLYAGASFPDAQFAEATYGETSIRFINFGSPDRSLDYAVVDSFLVVTTSKNSMYAVVDSIKQKNGIGSSGDMSSYLAGSPLGWFFFNFSGSQSEKLPQALQPYLMPFASMVAQIKDQQAFVGSISIK